MEAKMEAKMERVDEEIRVERIEVSDYEDVWRIFLEEGWIDYQLSDLDFLVDSSPETCFRFQDGGRLVGAMFANVLPSRVGFLGPIILDKEYRKHHWGRILPHTLMMSQYLDLQTKGCILYSAQHMKRLYQDLGGFTPLKDYSRFRLEADDVPAPDGVYRRPTPADAEAVRDFFREAYGDERRLLLERFPAFPSTLCLLAGDRRLDGFIMARKSLMGFNIGPCLARTPELAADLVKAVCRQLPGEKLILQGEIERTRFLLTFGGIPFEPTSVVSTKMVKGDVRACENEELIHGIFSFYLS